MGEMTEMSKIRLDLEFLRDILEWIKEMFLSAEVAEWLRKENAFLSATTEVRLAVGALEEVFPTFPALKQAKDRQLADRAGNRPGEGDSRRDVSLYEGVLSVFCDANIKEAIKSSDTSLGSGTTGGHHA